MISVISNLAVKHRTSSRSYGLRWHACGPPVRGAQSSGPIGAQWVAENFPLMLTGTVSVAAGLPPVIVGQVNSPAIPVASLRVTLSWQSPPHIPAASRSGVTRVNPAGSVPEIVA